MQRLLRDVLAARQHIGLSEEAYERPPRALAASDMRPVPAPVSGPAARTYLRRGGNTGRAALEIHANAYN